MVSKKCLFYLLQIFCLFYLLQIFVTCLYIRAVKTALLPVSFVYVVAVIVCYGLALSLIY